jgi:hypothetical protein
VHVGAGEGLAVGEDPVNVRGCQEERLEPQARTLPWPWVASPTVTRVTGTDSQVAEVGSEAHTCGVARLYFLILKSHASSWAGLVYDPWEKKVSAALAEGEG